MWWGCCEFRGRNRVQHGKYRRFRTDSASAFVTNILPGRRGAVMEPDGTEKRYRETVVIRMPSRRVGAGQEGNEVEAEWYYSMGNRGKPRGSTANLENRFL